MIQAAVSRQREYLADASAVQLTRNPQGLVGALAKIARTPLGSRLESPWADEVAHMLFSAGFDALFSSHPPLRKRIGALDPSFDLSRLGVDPASALLTDAPTALDDAATGLAPSTPSLLSEISLSPQALTASMGEPLSSCWSLAGWRFSASKRRAVWLASSKRFIAVCRKTVAKVSSIF